MSKQSFVIQGKQVNGTVIGAFAKRVGSIDDVISVWANAGVMQVVTHGNLNWLESLFSMPTMRLKSGKLSKMGKEVFSYIKAHCPNLNLTKETERVAYSKPKTDGSMLASHFIAVGHTAPIDGLVIENNGKFYTAFGDFSLTLKQYRDYVESKAAEDADDKDDTAPSMLAKAFNKQADKALATFESGRFIGTPEELFEAYAKAKALADKIDATLQAALKVKSEELAKLATIELVQIQGPVAPADMPIDTVLSAQLDQSGQAGKSKRAGGKVAPASEVAA